MERPAPKASNPFPKTCSFDALTIENVTFSGTGTLISATSHCRILIRNSKLSGEVIVDAASNSEITVEASTLEGSKWAIHLDGGSKLTAREQTVLRGKEAAVSAEPNTKLSLEATRVEGKQAGILLGSDVSLSAKETTIFGREDGLSATTNAKIVGQGLRLRGGLNAIKAQSSLTLELDRCHVESGETGIRCGLDSRVHVSGSEITAKHTGIEGDAYLELTVSRSSISGVERGLFADRKAKIRLQEGARVTGGKTAIESMAYLDIGMKSAILESATVGVCASFDAIIDIQNSKILAPEALRLRKQPTKLNLVESQVDTQIFDAAGCPDTAEKAEERARKKAAEAFMAIAPRPVSSANGAEGKAFDWHAAGRELDRATGKAAAVCGTRGPARALAIIEPVFSPAGRISDVKFQNDTDISPGAKTCIRGILKKVRIPPYDSNLPSPYAFRVVATR